MMAISFTFLVAEIILLIINGFILIFFQIAENCVYKALIGREVIFWLQVSMYFLITLYSILFVFKYKVKSNRRFISIFLFRTVFSRADKIMYSRKELFKRT